MVKGAPELVTQMPILKLMYPAEFFMIKIIFDSQKLCPQGYLTSSQNSWIPPRHYPPAQSITLNSPIRSTGVAFQKWSIGIGGSCSVSSKNKQQKHLIQFRSFNPLKAIGVQITPVEVEHRFMR